MRKKQLQEQLICAEMQIDNLEVQLRKQYQIVDEHDDKIVSMIKFLRWLKGCFYKLSHQQMTACIDKKINDLLSFVYGEHHDRI